MSQERKAIDRIEFIDIFRGLGIILMVMGHIGYGTQFDHFIHAFHMPMFFFVSGFFYKHKEKHEISVLEMIKKKAKSLLIPYFWFGIASYIIWLLYHDFSTRPLVHLLFYNSDGLPITGALWFLTALLITDVVYFLIDRYVSKESLKWIVVTSVSLFGNVAGTILPFTIPYAGGAALVGIGLFHLGYKVHNYQNNRIIAGMMNMRWYLWTIFSAIAVVLIFQNGYINMRSEEYANILMFWINAMLSIFIGMNLSRYIYILTKDGRICGWLSGIGRDSIVYVCMNQLIIFFINKQIKEIPQVGTLEWVVLKLLILAVSMAALWLCTQLITKTKLRMLIGRRISKKAIC